MTSLRGRQCANPCCAGLAAAETQRGDGFKHFGGYCGSGPFMTEMLAELGTSGLPRTIVATAESHIELHYLEMLHIAKARRDGVRVGNSNFGGPRPFPNL